MFKPVFRSRSRVSTGLSEIHMYLRFRLGREYSLNIRRDQGSPDNRSSVDASRGRGGVRAEREPEDNFPGWRGKAKAGGNRELQLLTIIASCARLDEAGLVTRQTRDARPSYCLGIRSRRLLPFHSAAATGVAYHASYKTVIQRSCNLKSTREGEGRGGRIPENSLRSDVILSP